MSIILLSLEKRMGLASFTSNVLQVSEYNLTTKISNSSNSSPPILSGVAIEKVFVNNGVISSIDILPFPDRDEVVSQPLNA